MTLAEQIIAMTELPLGRVVLGTLVCALVAMAHLAVLLAVTRRERNTAWRWLEGDGAAIDDLSDLADLCDPPALPAGPRDEGPRTGSPKASREGPAT